MKVSFTNLIKASEYKENKFQKKIINGISKLISKNLGKKILKIKY